MPHNFVLLVTLGGAHVPHRVPSEIDKWKDKLWKDETNSGTGIQNDLIGMKILKNIDVPLMSSLITLKRFHTKKGTLYGLSVTAEDLNLQQRYRYKDTNILGTHYFFVLNSTLGARQCVPNLSCSEQCSILQKESQQVLIVKAKIVEDPIALKI